LNDHRVVASASTPSIEARVWGEQYLGSIRQSAKPLDVRGTVDKDEHCRIAGGRTGTHHQEISVENALGLESVAAHLEQVIP
jgi:hypothetical protein